MLVRSDACPSAGDDEQQRFAHISLFFFFFRGQSPSAQNPKARCLFPLRPPPKASYRPLLLYWYMLYATRFLRLTSRKQDFIYSRPRASSFLPLPFFCAGSCVRETERMGDLRLQPGSQALPPPPPLSMPASPISPPPSELIAHTFPNKRKEGENPKEFVPFFFSGKVRELSRENAGLNCLSFVPDTATK